MKKLVGVWAASVTPFYGDYSVNHELLASHVRALLKSGCHGVVILGTTGEANSLSVGERIDLMDRFSSTDLPLERVLVGTGCSAHADTLKLTSHAVSLGFRGVLLLPPFYYKSVTDDGLFEGFKRLVGDVADEGLRIILYHFPRMAGVGYSVDLIRRLVGAFPSVVEGVKDSTGDKEHMLLLCENFPELRVFVGTESLLADALAAGGAGCISASVNVTSALCRRVYDALHASEEVRSHDEIDLMLDARARLEAYPFASVIKWILAELHKDVSWRIVRPPLCEVVSTEGLNSVLTAVKKSREPFQ